MNIPTQAKTGLEWATRHPPMMRGQITSRLRRPSGR
jgi:hypothetical protein